MDACFPAGDEFDGLTFETMNGLDPVVTTDEHPQPVSEPAVVARVQERRHPFQIAAFVACLLPEFSSCSRFQRFARLAVPPGKYPEPGRVQGGFIVAQLQQRGVVLAQQHNAPDAADRVG